ncbi:MAG: DUF1540 domain-containing protein [Oscillospiraceae bacterium]|nr:DUF1540 domain-containing protein [Oscillospiraceae bacterium]
MNNNNCVNKNIECSVTSCANHCCDSNYCALQKITVGTHGNATAPTNTTGTGGGTDCRSFKAK